MNIVNFDMTSFIASLICATNFPFLKFIGNQEKISAICEKQI